MGFKWFLWLSYMDFKKWVVFWSQEAEGCFRACFESCASVSVSAALKLLESSRYLQLRKEDESYQVRLFTRIKKKLAGETMSTGRENDWSDMIY